MSRYIEADKVLMALRLDHKDVIYIDKNDTAKRIEKIQGIDIVRCGECKFREANKSIYRGAWYCSNHGDTVDLDDYCSLGERREP